jgi:hypothetical protein
MTPFLLLTMTATGDLDTSENLAWGIKDPLL